MGRRRKGRPLHGWVNLDKPAGMSSAQAVAAVRRLTQAAKAGHGGTLDPLATGILPIALGEATKCMAFVMDGTKSYRFTVRWGQATATGDTEGDVTATSDVRPDSAAITDALPAFHGIILQVPPAYSAIKVDGQRAYALARDGEPVELAPRPVEIHRLALVEITDPDHAVFELDCGKGTYVRSLARDLGEFLGTFGHVASMRRTRVGPFDEGTAISLESLDELCQIAPPEEHLLPVETALDDIPALALTGPQAERMRFGQSIRVLNTADGTVCAMTGGKPVALASVQDGEVRPLRVFNL